MSYCIVYSQVDLVSRNIGAKVREEFNFVPDQKLEIGAACNEGGLRWILNKY